jgi:hypothetical protein
MAERRKYSDYMWLDFQEKVHISSQITAFILIQMLTYIPYKQYTK